MSREQLLGSDWYSICKQELEKSYFNELSKKLGWLYQNHPNITLPQKDKIFRVFQETRFNDVQIVILGQSPYPSKIHACGRAFASYSEYIPSSMEVILHSIDREIMFGVDIQKRCYLDCISESDYTLQHWVDQGILLLNSCMTTEVGKPRAHENQGWEEFISFIIRQIRDRKQNVCFLAWGTYAKKIMNPLLEHHGELFNEHLYVSCEHPQAAMYQNRKWDNHNCFKQVNDYRKSKNLELISW